MAERVRLLKELQKKERGFTLVEIIVVLVILAILAALLIPHMTGWIDKATEKSAVVGCRTCVIAAQTLASEQYAKVGAGNVVVSPAETLALAKLEKEGTVSGIDISTPANVDHLTYTDTASGISVTYCRTATCHKEHYNINAGGGGGGGIVNNGVSNLGSTMLDAINSLSGIYAFQSSVRNIDSTPQADGIGRTAKIEEYLQGAGVDLSKMNIAAWAVKRNNGTPVVLWTNQDIYQMTAGATVPVIRYNTKSGQYEVGYTEIEKPAGSSTLRMKEGGNITNAQAATDFENALALFNALP